MSMTQYGGLGLKLILPGISWNGLIMATLHSFGSDLFAYDAMLIY